MVKPIISNSVTAMPICINVCECSVQCITMYIVHGILNSKFTISTNIGFGCLSPPSPTEENCSCVCMWMCVRAFHFAQMDKRMNFMCAACGAPTFGYFIKLFTFNENENCNYGSVWLTFKKLFFELALFSMGDTNSTHFHSHIPFASRLFVLVFADGVHANEKPFLC